MSKKSFKKEKLDYVLKNHDKLSVKEMAENLSCAESTIYQIKVLLGVSDRYQWTEERVEILKDLYPSGNLALLYEKLETNNYERIVSKASHLGIKRDSYYYSDDDEKFITDNYQHMSYSEIAKTLGKTEYAIRTKVFKMDLEDKYNPWTPEDINLLESVYPHYTNKYLIKYYFPNRKLHHLIAMANKRGIYKTNEKKCKLYDKEEMVFQLSELAKDIGQTPRGEDLVKYGLPSSTSYRRYFGSYASACRLANLETNSNLFGKSIHCISKNNDLCYSKSEKIVTDFLIDHNIEYEKEVFYKQYINDVRCGCRKVDWYLIDYNVFVEYFGLSDKEHYLVKMDEKRSICKDNNMKLIEVFRKDVYSETNLARKFNDFIN